MVMHLDYTFYTMSNLLNSKISSTKTQLTSNASHHTTTSATNPIALSKHGKNHFIATLTDCDPTFTLAQ